MNQLPSHHIFCAGDLTVPFAALCSKSLHRQCPEALRDRLRIYVHVDALGYFDPREICEWFSAFDATIPIYGEFGIKPNRKFFDQMHQMMITETCRNFGHEQVLAFVDADNFLINEAWFEFCTQHDPLTDYCVTQGLRRDRNFTRNGQTFHSAKTMTFTLSTDMHAKVCDARHNKDERPLKTLRRQFPHINIHMGGNLDTQVLASLKAQALGYHVRDVSAKMESVHIGGVSHISAEKFNNANVAKMWTGRLRLNNATRRHLSSLGWDRFVDPRYAKRLEQVTRTVLARPELRELYETLPPTRDEENFKTWIQQLEVSPTHAPV